MADASGSAPVSATESARTLTIIIYLLYLAALVNGLTAIVGVALAYAKREDARGTPYDGHLSNAIEIFWVFLLGMLVAVPLCFVVIGIPLVIGLYIWVIFRTVKGLVRAIDGRPYNY
ncbi:MAG: DUF4870 domain-containing protein [Alphaproteobacteria bacterium]|nr:DUF4870 domain-containing protein [Alphaproteobacteria bacterium]MDE2112159.1 DUF4870 domain-containing protein [Alphaproteobacteria bacterium]MDE2495790.1 DUF4870 domain-containing protein [Alphaproteobacteria bacterium]